MAIQSVKNKQRGVCTIQVLKICNVLIKAASSL